MASRGCFFTRLLALPFFASVSAQIANSDCSTTPGLCVPRLCPAPAIHKAARPPPDSYTFTTADGSGATTSISFTPSENLHGYRLDAFCAPSVNLTTAPPILDCGDACPPPAPPPPLFSASDEGHTGCSAIVPNILTLPQQVDAALIPVWIFLIALLFYALAMVCEEFLVPAINILCVKTSIPDDVAGATLLAAGCNSPELFASIIGIFVADSTVGVGTVIGSAPFNLFCITAGAALAMGGNLVLDPWLMARELFGLLGAFGLFLLFMDDYLIEWYEALIMVLFYCCVYVPLLAYFDKIKSILLRLAVGTGIHGTQSEGGGEVVFTSFLAEEDPAHVLALGSGARESSARLPASSMDSASGGPPAKYPLDGNGASAPPGGNGGARADSIASAPRTSFSGGVRGSFTGYLRGNVAASLSKSLASSSRVTFGISDMLRASASNHNTPEQGFGGYSGMGSLQIELQPIASMRTKSGREALSGRSGRSDEASPGRGGGAAGQEPDLPSLRAAGIPGGLPPRSSFSGPPPTNPYQPSLSDLVEQCKKRCDGYPNSDQGFEGLLMKKPRGFAKVRVRGIKWQARFFVLDNHPTNPLRYSHADQKTRFITLPLQHVHNIERVGLEELHLSTEREVFKLRLPYGEPPSTMQRWFDQIICKIDELGYAPPPPTDLVGELTGEALDDEEHDHGPWWAMPESALGKVVHVLTFPLKAPVFLTTPNVLLSKNEKYFPITIIVSMLWLALFATLMTDLIEYLGCGIAVNSTVMGLSLGAIGTSFPNLYASILVARAGQGGMAICQAIASNTFNVCICLALLWLLHTIGIGSCDYGSHGAWKGMCNGCYAPSGFTPLCPFWEGTNNEFGTCVACVCLPLSC